MGMRRILVVVTGGILLVGCAGFGSSTIDMAKAQPTKAEVASRANFVGTWLEVSRTKDGGTRRALSTNAANGHFEIEFENTAPDGTVSTSREYGVWGVSGDIYFVATFGWIEGRSRSPADRTNGYFDDAYRIISASEREVEYVHIPSGNRHVKRRVTEGFRL